MLYHVEYGADDTTDGWVFDDAFCDEAHATKRAVRLSEELGVPARVLNLSALKPVVVMTHA